MSERRTSWGDVMIAIGVTLMLLSLMLQDVQISNKLNALAATQDQLLKSQTTLLGMRPCREKE